MIASALFLRPHRRSGLRPVACRSAVSRRPRHLLLACASSSGGLGRCSSDRPAAGDRRGRRAAFCSARRCSAGSAPGSVRVPASAGRHARPRRVAQLGVILYMFLVGLELDADALRGQVRTTVVDVARQHRAAVRARIGAGVVSVSAASRRSDVPVHAASRSSSASRCRSPRFRCWRGSSRTGGMTQTELGALALTCGGDWRRDRVVPAGVRRRRGARPTPGSAALVVAADGRVSSR